MEWSDLLSQAFLVGTFAAAVRLSVPLLFASLGEVIAERSGVINMGLEGFMLIGALAGFAVTYSTQNPLIATIASCLIGAVIGVGVAYPMVYRGVNQAITGIIFVSLAQGLTSFVARRLSAAGEAHRIYGAREIAVPLLSRIPVLGPILFQQNAYIYLALLFVMLVYFFLYRTTWGLALRAVGEDPLAGETYGLNVFRIRFAATVFCCAMAALAGAYLTIGQTNFYTENISAGWGWIAVALVVFANRHPFAVLGASLLFGFIVALQLRLQSRMSSFPYEFMLMLPYLMTLIVLVMRAGKVAPPAALAKPYQK